jgi:hypothetical protein
MVQVNVWVTLTADDYVRFSHGLFHFVELTYQFSMFQDVRNPLVGESNSFAKTVV